MTPQDIQNISAIGLIALFIWVVIKPLMPVLINKAKDKLNGTNGYSHLEKRLNQLENNHLEDVNRRLNNLERDTRELRDDIEEVKIRVVRIEARMNGKN